MPSYPYRCEKCEHTEDHFQRISEQPLRKCPSCNALKYTRVFTEPNAIVRGQPKTFGQAAEENAKRVGREQLQKMAEADKDRAKFTGKLPKGASINTTGTGATPPWRDGSMGVPRMDGVLPAKAVSTPAKRKKYIETGKVS